MCQISVVVEHNGEQEKVMDNVTGLQVTDEGVVLTAFFEEPLSVLDAIITKIDFLGGKVILNRMPGKK